jgi:hypothetical protein
MKSIVFAGLLLHAAIASGQDWPQACYNETSMWVTNACKTYIEQVYLPEQEAINAAPTPVLGSGIGALVLLGGAVTALLWRRRHRGPRG